jgi:hypothetical protein
VKYETPVGQRNGIDVPPGVGPLLDDPAIQLWVTEGAKKADAAAVRGLACVSLPGVWSWRGTNSNGGKTAVADWHDIALNGRKVVLAFDSDVVTKKAVAHALGELARYLESKGAAVAYCHLPHGEDGKTGLDDFLVEHEVEDLHRLVRPDSPAITEVAASVSATAVSAETVAARPGPVTLAECHTVFRRWLGAEYDLDALNSVLATAAVERLDGDPLWLLVISGSGNAKTETVQALAGAGAVITSTISSAGGLLSATPTREKAKDATGGLLRTVEPSGLLVVKDVTSILSMNRDSRAEVLAALREVHDGYWSRNVGTDGGRTLNWKGRIGIVGAVTTAWDRAHDVIASMGDRFVMVRMDSTTGRQAAGRRAIGNTGSETAMRAELSDAVAGVLSTVNGDGVKLTDVETDYLLAAADIVTLARTGVEYDYRGDVIDAHAPEMPTRFAKQLGQVVRGAVAVGMDRTEALRLAVRCARDSMPPLRLAIVDDVAANPETATRDVRRRLSKPRNTIDRQLQALHILGVLVCDEQKVDGRGVVWRYSVAEHIDETALNPENVPDLSVHTPSPIEEEQDNSNTHRRPTDISGTSPALLDDLRSRPGRCRECGSHVETQGHASDCEETP